MLKPIVALMVLLCSFTARADVAARVAVKATDVAKHTAWMHAMEARVESGTLATEPLPSLERITAWLGWGIALVAFLALIVGHVRVRRHNAFLMRAGERDDFIIRRPR